MFHSRWTDTLQFVTKVAVVAVAVDTDSSDELCLDVLHHIQLDAKVPHCTITFQRNCCLRVVEVELHAFLPSVCGHQYARVVVCTVAGLNAEEK